MHQKTILSTKKLSAKQKELLVDFQVEEEKFIEVELQKDIQLKESIECSVFTSQNAVKAVFKESSIEIERFEKTFCVGNKTAKLLDSFGIEVAGVANSAYELAELLIRTLSLSKGSNEKITFFCGNLRRDELPDLLRENNFNVEEIEVYETKLLLKKIKKEFDGVLFFSPSAIQSYIEAGNSIQSTAFCIGNTTAVAAIMEFEKVYVAEFPSVEAVLQSVNENL